MTWRDVALGTLAFIAIVAIGLAIILGTRGAPEPVLLVDSALTEGKGPSIICVPASPPDVKAARQQWIWA